MSHPERKDLRRKGAKLDHQIEEILTHTQNIRKHIRQRERERELPSLKLNGEESEAMARERNKEGVGF